MLEALGELSNGQNRLTVVIEDVSTGGARIRLGDEAASQFFGSGWTLSSPILGSIPLRIRWRQVDAAGVQFDLPAPHRRRLARLVGTIGELGPATAVPDPTRVAATGS